MREIRKVLIAGGGIGGLSAAIAFAQKGVAVQLVEKRRDFKVPGVGLGQPACALRRYHEFGVLEEILDTGFCYDHMSIFDPSRTLIASHRFQMGGDAIPAFCALPRATLHDILLRRATALGVELRLGARIGAHSGAAGTDIQFDDGTDAGYDLIAGFDGIRSSARNYIYGDIFVPRHSGYGAWRIQAERPDFVTGMEFLQGVGGKAGAIPIAKERMYLFNIRPEPEGVVFRRDQMHLLWKERLSQFGSYVADIAADLNPSSSIVYGAIEPFIVPYPWNKGRVVIGGDAAHVIPPHLTAGAAMAVEDAYSLARCVLSADGTVDQRLEHYGRTRFARNAFLSIFARDWMDAEQSVSTPDELKAAKAELSRNADARIAVADRILDAPDW
jgi:2-polyprenyl-6-methoxyphenol hydroxylase-like FAD-dependent oxidoreductase